MLKIYAQSYLISLYIVGLYSYVKLFIRSDGLILNRKPNDPRGRSPNLPAASPTQGDGWVPLLPSRGAPLNTHDHDIGVCLASPP